MKRAMTLCISLVLFAVVALAHGGEEHLMGTVTKVAEKSITIEDKNGKTIEVGVSEETKFMKGEATAALKDVKVGDRLVIEAKKNGNKFAASLVKIGVAAARPPRK